MISNVKPCKALLTYSRLSVKKKNGRLVEDVSESIERQDEHNEDRATREGHTIAYRLCDDGKSAYDLSVVREDWERGLQLIRDGKVDGILAWNEDRMARQPIDGIHLMNAAKAAGIPVMVGTAGKAYDFTDSTDEFMFLISCGLGKKSSDDTSRRVKDKLEKNRRAGKQHGRVGYGFMVNPADPKGPTIVNPAHERAINYAADAVLAGRTWDVILDDLDKQGVRTDDHGTIKGRPLTRATLRAILLAPRSAGLIVHEGKVVGRIPGQAILTVKKYEAVKSELLSRAHGAPRTTHALLSGFMACPNGNTMNFTYAQESSKIADRLGRDPVRYDVYKCQGSTRHQGGTARTTTCSCTVMASHAESKVRDAVLRWYSQPRHLAKIVSATGAVSAKRAELETELERLRNASARNAEKLAEGIWTEEQYDKLDAPLSLRIKALKAEVDRYSEPELLRDMQVAEVATSWEAATVDQRRAMIKVALKSVTVVPASTGKRGRDRVQCLPR